MTASSHFSCSGEDGATRRLTRRFLRAAGDFLLPHRCPSCAVPLRAPGGLCASCWTKIRFLDDFCCRRCGHPFATEADRGEDFLCLACLARPPVYDRALAAAIYDDASRDLILALKHADRTDAAPILARWLVRAGAPLRAHVDILTPTPLHRGRLWRRRYNQAALLTAELARAWNKPWEPELLLRVKATQRQGRLSAAARRRNMQGAFAVGPGMKRLTPGARVLLVDDVLTTGATAEACARSLKRAGAGAVFLLTLARVDRPRRTEF